MTAPLTLESDELRAELHPDSGAEMRSLRSLRSGRELLFQAPWPDPGGDRGAGEDTWTRGWRGGWQVLFPSGGSACENAGRRHPFHGDAALAAFEVIAQNGASATLTWTDPQGLALTRRFALGGARLRVETEVRKAGSEPAGWMLVDHLILGGELAAPGARIDAEGAMWPLALDSSPLAPREEPPHWPSFEGEDWSLVPERASRYCSVFGGPPRASVTNPAGDLAAAVTWDPEAFPFLWCWLEADAEESDPWDGRTRCLGIEPSSAAAGDGLAARAAAGEARSLAPGAVATAWTELAVEDSA